MTSVLYGFLSALTWGAGDFTGGIVSRRAGVYRAAFYGEAAGLVLLLGALFFVGEAFPGWNDLGWSAAAGAIGSLGLLMLFRSLAEGKMSVAAPVSALMAAVLPVLAGALTEGLPEFTQYVGFALALTAIWLISRGDDHQKKIYLHLADLWIPLLSGVCFGFYFILIHQGSQASTIWPMTAARSAGTILLLFFAIAKQEAGWPARPIVPLVAINALGDIGGNTFYILAGQTGRLDVAAVLGSLYPGMTVLLAGIFLHERLNRSQWIGIAAALAAIVLMTI